ncbi:MAG: EamA family transporter [Flavobacteriales bacterium]|nr:EamA family transporter [Flavobacteriales bacterium]NNK80730.1 EamA family transporter [Flavobacteriales bacterium]
MSSRRGLLLAHFSILLFALSGVIAKAVDQSAVVLSCSRSLLAAVILGAILIGTKGLPRVRGKNVAILFASGVLLALHWVCFYQSIKVSSVSIGVVTVTTFPVMTAILEPFVMREPWSWKLLLSPLVVLIGTIILLGFSPSPSDVEGMIYGFLAALIFVFIHFINKFQVSNLRGNALSFIQLGIAGLVLLPWGLRGFDYQTESLGYDIGMIIFLAVFSTAMAYSLFIESMRNLSARTAAILTGLEPVYAITIAIIFLDEHFSWNMFLGALIILISVVYSSLQSLRANKLTQNSI